MLDHYTLRDFQYIMAPVLGWLVAQSIKYVIQLRKDGTQWRDFIASGGMPSSHSSFTMSLTTLIGHLHGINSALFGLAVAVTMLAVYDAMDVRRATGHQTIAIHEIEKAMNIKLKTHIHKSKGHRPIEVVAGLCVGITVGSLIFALL